MKFYIYEWFIKDTGEIIYVGKGCNNRYKVKKHNRLFNEIIKRFDCESRIIKFFDNEMDAFNAEFNRINELKNKNQCVCNINKGGYGGQHDLWTDEMRKKYSENNIMKTNSQRKRMSINNPMKNGDISKIVASKKKRKISINNNIFNGLVDASKYYNVSTNTILNWCKRGYDTKGNPCRYFDLNQKEYNFKITNSKKVIIDDIKFSSIKKASEYIGVWPETLIRAIKNNRKCKGHECKYDNQQPSINLND